jgi:hypothetical protein
VLDTKATRMVKRSRESHQGLVIEPQSGGTDVSTPVLSGLELEMGWLLLPLLVLST